MKGITIFAAASAIFMSGCAVLYMPQTYYTAQTSDVVAPFSHVFVEFSADVPVLRVSLGDSDSSKLKHLCFLSATMTNENGGVTQLNPRREILENPNSFLMEFGKADYLGHDLHFRITVLSGGVPMVITFQTRMKSRVYWPKDSDYSG